MALTVTVDGNDLTDFLQDRSLSVKRNGADFTLIDPSSVPAVNDTVALTDPTWSGALISVESAGYKGDVPFYRCRATNADVLVDGGAAPFDLADTGTAQSSPAGFKDLSVQRQLQGATVETRAQCTVFKSGLAAGMTIDITSVVEGFSGETFTIMDLTTEYPTEDGPTFHLDLGLGAFATATTGADDGGPLDPIDLTTGIIDVVTDAGCCDDGVGGGGGGGAGDPNGITDTFTRSTSNVDGDLSDAGVAYDVTDTGAVTPASASSDGTKLDVELSIGNANHPTHVAQLTGSWGLIYNAVASIQFTLSAATIVASQRVTTVGGQLRSEAFYVYIDCRVGGGAPYSLFGFPAANSTTIPTAYWVAGRTYTVTGVDDGTNTTYTLSDGTTDYTLSRSAARTSPILGNPNFSVSGDTTGITSTETSHVYFDNLDIPEIKLATVSNQVAHRPVIMEYTTLPGLGASPEAQTVDTYYDYQFNTVTSAALEAIGFYTSDDITFTSSREGPVHISGGFTLDPTPTTPSIISIVAPGLSGGINYKFTVNDTADIPLQGIIYFAVGDFVRLDLWGTITDQPISYGWISLARMD